MHDTAGPDPTAPTDVMRDAILSEDNEYRYRLDRTWDSKAPTMAFVLVNPSQADAEKDDRTTTRCMTYANGMGFGRVIIGNLFAIRSTDPTVIKSHPAPVGPRNDQYLRDICHESDRIVAGWGIHGTIDGRGHEITAALDVNWYAITTTIDGHPAHPSRTPYDTTLQRFSYD
ncbi:DUF1643 domain-containing protein [Haloquadratum walsbyi]|uniref:Uncharacterized protein n=1 Tax=Haloquadratum walsbyi (strain DSM 16854 / JCM 12705 / C23) TaxID=768065 RepID=G0LK24_HALWC|nr:DUF1643 domain-containing protein [Haloquadratum walsbyi]CCC39450.1 uncharacterized protein Hqrw_1504 [Haloquadratum walsbyi C23]